MEKLTKIDASPEAKGLENDLRAGMPETMKEFDVLLARYKKQSPEKYEEKLADGTFEKQAIAMGLVKPKKAEPKKIEEKKEEPKKTKK